MAKIVEKSLSVLKKNYKMKVGLSIIYAMMIFVYIAGTSELGNLMPSTNQFVFYSIIFFMGGLIIFLGAEEKYLHIIAFIIVLVFGLINCFNTPILDSPDENAHLRRAEITSRGEFFPQPLNEDGYKIISSVVNIEKQKGNSVFNGSSEKINYEVTTMQHIAISNFFIGYLPQAFGIILAKIFGLPEIGMLLLGRMGNTVFAAFMAGCALKMVNKFKIPLMVICCLPMSVYQAGSLSIDTTINYGAIIVIAYFIKLFEMPDRSIDYKYICWFFLLCIVPGISKITYMALACLIVLLPKSKFVSNKYYLSTFLGVLSLVIIALGWYMYTLAMPQIINEQNNYLVENNVNVVGQLKFILAQPIQVLHMLMRQSIGGAQQIFNGFFTFGWLSYGSSFLVFSYMLFYGSIIFLYPVEIEFSKKIRIGVLVIMMLIFFATELIMYLTWTRIGATVVAGVQGRYFVPLLAMLPIVFNLNITLKTKKNLESYYVFFMVLFLTFLSITTRLNYY